MFVVAEDKNSVCLVAITIRSMNGKIERMALGTWILEFSHYAPAPNNIAETVIAKSKGKVNIDE